MAKSRGQRSKAVSGRRQEKGWGLRVEVLLTDPTPGCLSHFILLPPYFPLKAAIEDEGPIQRTFWKSWELDEEGVH
jgi:hypothetical protein